MSDEAPEEAAAEGPEEAPEKAQPEKAQPGEAQPAEAQPAEAQPGEAEPEKAEPAKTAEKAQSEVVPPRTHPTTPRRSTLARRVGVHVRRSVALAAVTGLVAGAIDGSVSAASSGHAIFAGLVVGAGVVALVGVLWGIVQGALVAALAAVADKLELGARWQAMTTADRDADREPVIQLTTTVLLTALAAGLLTTGFSVFHARTARIKEAALRDDVIVLAVGGLLLTVGILMFVLRPPTARLVGWFDRRVGLPFPRWAWLRYTLFVAAPAGLILVPLFSEYGIKLGILGPAFGLLLFIVAEGWLWRIVQALPLERPLAKRVMTVLIVAVVGASGWWSSRSFYAWEPTHQVVSDAAILPTALDVVKSATDFDGDGITSVFGGDDCAPFDGTRAPSRQEIPRNGIDEDCDGVDLEEARAVVAVETFYGKLSPKKTRPFNVLLIVIDSLRADHVTHLGYSKKTTPHLDELAEESWTFTKAQSQSSTTALSMPSMLAGRYPGSMRWVPGYPQPDKSERLLPRILRENGYDTTIVINQYVKRHLRGMQGPFEHVQSVPKGVDWRSGEYVISGIISSMERAAREKKPFFVTAHFDDVHHPYRAHDGRNVPTFTDKNRDRGNYDRCIANLDNMLRPLVSHMRNIGAWDNTVVIITSDHGEEFLEHGGTIHSATCYIESVHVPLIVRVPGFRPARVKTPVALVDLVPTVLEATGIRDETRLDGQSLFVPVLAPERANPERPLFCSIFQLLSGRKNFFIRSVRAGDLSLVDEALSDNTELFDRRVDPGEKKNVAKQRPEDLERLQELLDASLTGNLWEARRFK